MLGDYEKLNKRMQTAIDEKGRWLVSFQNLYRYVIPDRNAYNVRFNYKDEGLLTTQQIWDTTAMIAAYQRANDLHGLLLPQDRNWGSQVLNPQRYNQAMQDAFAPKLDNMNQTIQWNINQSNLARVVSGSLLDLNGGTAAMWVESPSNENPIQFRGIASITLYIEYCTDDVIYTCWCSLPMSARTILEKFPKYNGEKRSDLEANPDEVHVVFYGQVKQPNGNFLIYAVLETDPMYPLWETEKSYQQIIVFRDRVRPGEADGRGIGLDMLPTIVDLNRIVMYDRKSYAFKALPPFFVDPGSFFNPYTMGEYAGAQIVRDPTSNRNPIEAMIMPETPQVFETIQFLQQTIKDAFHVDPLGEVTLPKMSATEVAERQNEAQRTSATDISRLINELPKQVYEVTAKILNERKLLNVDRSLHQEIEDGSLIFDYQSPLYELQNESDLQNFNQALQFTQQYWGEGAVMIAFDAGQSISYLRQRLKLPSNLCKSPPQINNAFIEMAKAAQQQQQSLPVPTTSPQAVNSLQQPGPNL